MINHLAGEVLTPMASQVSRYYTDMTSASMVSHSIKESSHHSNSNHYNPMSMKEPLEKKPTLCPTSNLEQSGAPWDTTSASMNTSAETRPSSHSTYERLWNVNQLGNAVFIGISDRNCGR